MNRTRMLVFATFALVLSVFVTVMAYRVMQNRLEPGEESFQIVVAAEKLPVGKRIEAGDLRVQNWPRRIPLEGVFSDPSEIVGRGVIVPLIVNEPVLESKLAPEGAGAGLTSTIPAGMRAVSVKVNDVIGVAGFVLPGTRVDVILTGHDDEVETSRIILENIQVLAAGQKLQQEVDNQPQEVQVITLLVTPEEAQTLVLASSDGRIQLALRNPLDLDKVSPSPVRKPFLYGSRRTVRQPAPAPVARQAAPSRPTPPPKVEQKPAPPPAPVLPLTISVELIQGQKREKLTFKQP